MKKRKTIYSILSLTLLMPLMLGCSKKPSSSTSDEKSETSLSEITTEKNSSSDSKPDVEKIVDLYAVNDVHGRILEKTSGSHYEPGLARTATYLNQLEKTSNNMIFLNSGDMFQDTYDSYSNYGNLMAESMPLMKTEAMAIGNHEFDWGIDKLIKNKELAGNTAFLGANIYHYDETMDKATTFASELGDEYKIVERNGLKIGVIGIIGKDQITSIMSKLVENYIFLEPTPIVQKIADKLKGEQHCDAVVVTAHADLSQLQEQSSGAFAKNVTSISPETGKRYVDAVFTAHTHKNQKDMYNNVPFIQSYCHGEKLGHIQLDLNESNPKCSLYEHIDIPRNLKADPTVQAVIDKYLTPEYFDKKENPIGTTDIYKLSRHNAGNMLAWITYETLMSDENLPVDNIDVVMNNGGRTSVNIDNGELTREVIFNALPFTNKTYVAKVKGYDVVKQTIDYGYPYYAPKAIKIDPNATYTIACIDYTLFHKNPEREYNYFKSFTGETLYCEPRYSCDLISDYIIQHSNITYNEVANKQEYKNISK